MTDESGDDAKILAVPTTKLCRSYECVNELKDMPQVLVNQIAHFFEHYKDLDEGKWVRVEGWGDIDDAKAELLASVEMYNNAKVKPNF
jgi:inorganic pyrophosphatase